MWHNLFHYIALFKRLTDEVEHIRKKAAEQLKIYCTGKEKSNDPDTLLDVSLIVSQHQKSQH